MELAKQVGTQIFRGKSMTLSDGSSIRITEFDIKRLGKIPLATNPQELRTTVDGITETMNRQAMLIGTNAGGVLALAVQSIGDDTFMTAIFDTLSDSAKRQFSKTRGGMFLAGLDGLEAEQLRSIAGQDNDMSQQSTALRIAVSKFLSGTDRDHVIGVGFLSENDLIPADEGVVESGGVAYYFPKRESPFWSDDFSGLFSWANTCRDKAIIPAGKWEPSCW